MITIFTPSFADEADTNAQNLTVKEVVARLSPDKCKVVMLHDRPPDPRIVGRPNTRLLRWRRRGNTLRALGQCLREVPDVYFFPREGPLDAAFLLFRRALGLKTSIVTYVVAGGLYNPAALRPALARNVREADAVFANSRYLSALVHQRFAVPAGIRYDGIDRRFFFAQPDTRPSFRRGLTVLFAGSFRPYKRVDLVVRQAARWRDVQFRILGRGEEEGKCRKLAEELGCSNVSFCGHLLPQQVGEEMRRADIFFFPSIIEGHPQVLAQAAASGLPAVAMKIYRPEYVVNDKTGFLVDSDQELEAKLDLLITQPELRKLMSEAAVEHARQYDWDLIALQWQEAFEEVVARRRSR